MADDWGEDDLALLLAMADEGGVAAPDDPAPAPADPAPAPAPRAQRWLPTQAPPGAAPPPARRPGRTFGAAAPAGTSRPGGPGPGAGTELFAGFTVSKPLVSSLTVRERLAEFPYRPLMSLASGIFVGGDDDRFGTAGVVVKQLPIRESRAGKPFSVWKLQGPAAGGNRGLWAPPPPPAPAPAPGLPRPRDPGLPGPPARRPRPPRASPPQCRHTSRSSP